MGHMETTEEERLKNPDPIAEGRGAPTREEKQREEEEREKQTDREIEKARADVDMAATLAPQDEKVQDLKNELLGANAKTIDPNRLQQVAREARDKAAEKTQQTVAGGMMTLAGIGLVLKNMGVTTNGTDYPAALAGTDSLPRNIAGLPTRDRQDSAISIG